MVDYQSLLCITVRSTLMQNVKKEGKRSSVVSFWWKTSVYKLATISIVFFYEINVCIYKKQIV